MSCIHDECFQSEAKEVKNECRKLASGESVAVDPRRRQNYVERSISSTQPPIEYYIDFDSSVNSYFPTTIPLLVYTYDYELRPSFLKAL